MGAPVADGRYPGSIAYIGHTHIWYRQGHRIVGTIHQYHHFSRISHLRRSVPQEESHEIHYIPYSRASTSPPYYYLPYHRFIFYITRRLLIMTRSQHTH